MRKMSNTHENELELGSYYLFIFLKNYFSN